jgi:hypothetical protein
VFCRSALITKADGQQAFPSVTAQKTASFSLSFRPQSQIVALAASGFSTSKRCRGAEMMSTKKKIVFAPLPRLSRSVDHSRAACKFRLQTAEGCPLLTF